MALVQSLKKREVGRPHINPSVYAAYSALERLHVDDDVLYEDAVEYLKHLLLFSLKQSQFKEIIAILETFPYGITSRCTV